MKTGDVALESALTVDGDGVTLTTVEKYVAGIVEQEDDMAAERDALEALNVDIGDAESRGDKAFFEALLAPSFAFRRANGAVVDRTAYLDAVAASAARTTSIRSISFAGRARAVVTCVVTMDVQGAQKDFDNLRVFVRSDNGAWKLLAWANEPV